MKSVSFRQILTTMIIILLYYLILDSNLHLYLTLNLALVKDPCYLQTILYSFLLFDKKY